MQILGRTQPLAKYPVLRALKVIKALGFDGVEICLENEDMAPSTLTPEIIAAVRQKVAELGLKPFSISYHVDYLYDDALLEMSKTVIQMTQAQYSANSKGSYGRCSADYVEEGGLISRSRMG